jgi:hypothetical protein
MPNTNQARVWFETIIGSRITDEDAAIIGPELAKIIRANQGRWCAADIVEAARDPASPLHPYFEWDKDTAAQLYNEDQARHMTRGIYVAWNERQDGETIKQSVRLCEWVVISEQSQEEIDEDEGDAPKIRPGRKGLRPDRRTRRAVTFDYVVEQDDLKAQKMAEFDAALQRLERRFQYYMDLWPDFKETRRRVWNAIKALGETPNP